MEVIVSLVMVLIIFLLVHKIKDDGVMIRTLIEQRRRISKHLTTTNKQLHKRKKGVDLSKHQLCNTITQLKANNERLRHLHRSSNQLRGYANRTALDAEHEVVVEVLNKIRENRSEQTG